MWRNRCTQVTCIGVPALLYVASKSKFKVVVEMKGGDLSEYGDADFDYVVEGVRDGFENHQTVRDIGSAAETDAPSLSPKRKKVEDGVLRIRSAVEKKSADKRKAASLSK